MNAGISNIRYWNFEQLNNFYAFDYQITLRGALSSGLNLILINGILKDITTHSQCVKNVKKKVCIKSFLKTSPTTNWTWKSDSLQYCYIQKKSKILQKYCSFWKFRCCNTYVYGNLTLFARHSTISQHIIRIDAALIISSPSRAIFIVVHTFVDFLFRRSTCVTRPSAINRHVRRVFSAFSDSSPIFAVFIIIIAGFSWKKMKKKLIITSSIRPFLRDRTYHTDCKIFYSWQASMMGFFCIHPVYSNNHRIYDC